LAVRGGERDRSRLLVAARRIVLWTPRGHRQIWVTVVLGYLACAVLFPLLGGSPRRGDIAFVMMTAPWDRGRVRA
jgi:hypothetical protein